jgi:hypothetical protein
MGNDSPARSLKAARHGALEKRLPALDVESGGLGVGEVGFVGLKSLLDLRGGELLNLLRGTADEGAGVEEGVELVEDRGEEFGATDAVEEVVVFTELLDVVGGLVGEDTWDGRLC